MNRVALPPAVVRQIWRQVNPEDTEFEQLAETKSGEVYLKAKWLWPFCEIAVNPPHFAAPGDIVYALSVTESRAAAVVARYKNKIRSERVTT